MRKWSSLKLISVMVLILSFSCKSIPLISEGKSDIENHFPALIPLPGTISEGQGFYVIPDENIICYSEGNSIAATWLRELLRKAGKNSVPTLGNSCGNWNLNLDTGLAEALGEEGYILDITGEGISITGATEAGLFYGIQTLRQFFPPEIEQKLSAHSVIPLHFVHIEDKPNYSWRGTMVDVARSFFGIDVLKRHIDKMAMYKMNRLHLHLTDDQGWRIEIKGWPKLTEIGSKGAVLNGQSGFLTQEEYKELQDYALARNIVIIPEIDLPGHIYAALASYPELNCDDNTNIDPKRATPPEMFSGHEVGWSKLCLDKPEIYQFVGDVIGELAKITEGPWIHIGGDEIEDPRYKDFVVKADSIVRANGKTSIGWEEVSAAEVDPSLISQQWHGKTDAVVDIKVIKSICTSFYLDHANVPGQETTNNWCKEDGVSLKDVYTFTAEGENVLGVEAPVWTENVWDENTLEDRFWPRAIAVAEVGWTTPEIRNFENFIFRLKDHGERLNHMGVNFYATPDVEWVPAQKWAKRNSVFAGFMPSEINQ